MEIFGKSRLKLGLNTALPSLPVWRATSFWAQLLAALIVLFNMAGIDLMGALRDMGLGASPSEVIDNGQRAVGAVQILLPFLLGVWAWLERQAPRFCLNFGGGA